MKFGIILCPRCHRGLGFELRFKSTKCPFCGAGIKIKPNMIKFKADTEKDLAIMTSKLNEQLDENRGFEKTLNFDIGEDDGNRSETRVEDEKTIYEQLDPVKRIALKFKNEPESMLLIKNLVLHLSMELGEFSSETFQDLFKECKLDDKKCEDYLNKLKELAIIYEPRAGVYRIVDDE